MFVRLKAAQNIDSLVRRLGVEKMRNFSNEVTIELLKKPETFSNNLAIGKQKKSVKLILTQLSRLIEFTIHRVGY